MVIPENVETLMNVLLAGVTETPGSGVNLDQEDV